MSFRDPAPTERRRRPMPPDVWDELMRVAPELLTEPIRSGPPQADRPEEPPMPHDDHQLSEEEVRSQLNLSEHDFASPEVLVALDGRARPERGPGLWFSRSHVEKAKLWLGQREQAGAGAAEKQKADLLLAEMREAGLTA